MLDQVMYGLAAIVALISACLNALPIIRSKDAFRLLWFFSFIFLFVLTASMSLKGLEIVGESYVPPLASFIPGFLSCGLVYAMFGQRCAKYYLTYILLFFLLLVYASAVGGIPLTLPVLFIHVPSGVIIFAFPIVAVVLGKSDFTALLLSIGGLLIGIGGLALAAIRFGNPLLSLDLITKILAPLFLEITIFFSIGTLTTKKWSKVGEC
jgi:hypothetical protein